MIRSIVLWPDPLLLQVSIPVDPVELTGGAHEALIDDMVETMASHRGTGLAAVQVGVLLRILVIRLSKGSPDAQVCVNPRVVRASLARPRVEEGCLSVPDFYGAVSRPISIDVEFLDRTGAPVTMMLQGLGAQAFQHELDHLNGKMFIERLDAGARDRLRARLRKAKAVGAAR